MKSNEETKSFKNEKEAEILLRESRKRIDEIDNELYVCIGMYTENSKYYKINDEYVSVFLNAINSK